MEKIKCPECKKRLGDFLICADKVADLFYWEDKEKKFVIARGTTLNIVKNWKQAIEYQSQEKKKNTSAYWKKEHSIRMYADFDSGHVSVYNNKNQRAKTTALCKLPEDIYEIEGPGAKAQEEADRVQILEMQLKEETKKRKEAEAEAAEERDNRTAEKLNARFKDIGVEGVRVHRPFHSSHASGLHMSFEAAKVILYNLADLDDKESLRRRLIKISGVCSWEELVKLEKSEKLEKKAS